MTNRRATVPTRKVYEWHTQVPQYAKTGEPGVTYEQNHIKAATGVDATGQPVPGPPVDCLLWRDPEGVLRGILNHYPIAIPPFEEAGNVNVWVDPDWQRRGIATALCEAAMQRWPVDLDQQSYTPAGAAFVAAWEQRQGGTPESTTDEKEKQ